MYTYYVPDRAAADALAAYLGTLGHTITDISADEDAGDWVVRSVETDE